MGLFRQAYTCWNRRGEWKDERDCCCISNRFKIEALTCYAHI